MVFAGRGRLASSFSERKVHHANITVYYTRVKFGELPPGCCCCCVVGVGIYVSLAFAFMFYYFTAGVPPLRALCSDFFTFVWGTLLLLATSVHAAVYFP